MANSSRSRSSLAFSGGKKKNKGVSKSVHSSDVDESDDIRSISLQPTSSASNRMAAKGKEPISSSPLGIQGNPRVHLHGNACAVCSSAGPSNRNPPLDVANSSSTSTTAASGKRCSRGASAFRSGNAKPDLIDFHEPLPNNDFESLIGAVLTVISSRQNSIPPSSQNSIRANSLPQPASQSANLNTSSKKVHFDPDIEERHNDQTQTPLILEFPPDSEDLASLIYTIKNFDPLRQAIKHLHPKLLSKIAWSLPHPFGEEITNLGCKMRGRVPICFLRNSSRVRLEKKHLLQFLDQQTHQRYLCRHCELFHPEPKRPKGKGCSWPAPLNAGQICATSYIIGNNRRNGRLFNLPFRFGEVQMAMKFYRLNMNHHQGLTPFNKTHSQTGNKVDYIWSSETYAVEGRLLSRIQHWYHLGPAFMKSYYTKKDMGEFLRGSRKHGGFTNLCRHLMERCEKEEKFVLWEFYKEEENPKVRRCDQCALEYRYDWYDVGELGRGTVLSVWRDFGRCLTPFDPRWMAHFEEYEGPKYVAKFKKDLESSGFASSSKGEQDGKRWAEDMESAATVWAVGDIQKIFEAEGGFNLKECTRRMKGRFWGLSKIRNEC